jgi:hypothetical protein
MNLQEVKSIAKERGIKPGNLKKVELIQALQREEGNPPCYATGRAAVCGETGCLWKDDCK